MKGLFKLTRQCRSCGRVQERGQKRPGESLVTIYPYMYSAIGEKKMQKGTNVEFCETCLAVAMATPQSKEGKCLALAVIESLNACYNAIIAVPNSEQAADVAPEGAGYLPEVIA